MCIHESTTFLGFIYHVDQSAYVTTKFIVSCGNADDDYITESKVVRLGTAGNIKFETPLKAGTFGMTSGCGIYEVYRYLKPETIRKCLDSQSYLSKYQKTTKSMRSDSALNLIALAYMNKDVAFKMLRSRLYEYYQKKREEEHQKDAIAKKDISWGNQIRSYVFQPYTLVKDHRTGCQTGNISAVMDGEIDDFIESYLHFQKEA